MYLHTTSLPCGQIVCIPNGVKCSFGGERRTCTPSTLFCLYLLFPSEGGVGRNFTADYVRVTTVVPLLQMIHQEHY